MTQMRRNLSSRDKKDCSTDCSEKIWLVQWLLNSPTVRKDTRHHLDAKEILSVKLNAHDFLKWTPQSKVACQE